MIRQLSVVFLLFAALPGASIAKPAAWYWWTSRVGDERICSQTSPGSGWYREPRPFRDGHCSIRL